jgi:hypothetical protein
MASALGLREELDQVKDELASDVKKKNTGVCVFVTKYMLGYCLREE